MWQELVAKGRETVALHRAATALQADRAKRTELIEAMRVAQRQQERRLSDVRQEEEKAAAERHRLRRRGTHFPATVPNEQLACKSVLHSFRIQPRVDPASKEGGILLSNRYISME